MFPESVRQLIWFTSIAFQRAKISSVAPKHSFEVKPHYFKWNPSVKLFIKYPVTNKDRKPIAELRDHRWRPGRRMHYTELQTCGMKKHITWAKTLPHREHRVLISVSKTQMINSKVQMAGRDKRWLPTAGNEIFLMERKKKTGILWQVFFFFLVLSSLAGFEDTNMTQIRWKWGGWSWNLFVATRFTFHRRGKRTACRKFACCVESRIQLRSCEVTALIAWGANGDPEILFPIFLVQRLFEIQSYHEGCFLWHQ